jgi:hypothetical protein
MPVSTSGRTSHAGVASVGDVDGTDGACGAVVRGARVAVGAAVVDGRASTSSKSGSEKSPGMPSPAGACDSRLQSGAPRKGWGGDAVVGGAMVVVGGGAGGADVVVNDGAVVVGSAVVVDGASGTAGDGAPKSALAMWLIARVRPAGSASGTVGAVGERTTAALTPGDTLGGCRVVGSTRLSSPGGCGCSGVLMVPVDGDVLEDAEGVVDEDGSGAVEGHEILGRALLVDAHQPDRE